MHVYIIYELIAWKVFVACLLSHADYVKVTSETIWSQKQPLRL